MDRETLGIVAFPVLFALLAFRVPIGLAMLIVGSAGTAMIAGWLPIFSQVKTSAWHLFSNYSLSVIPLFLLMGNFASRAGMSEALFKFASACLGHRKGGVAMAAVGACAGFGAICGSSLATAATMGKVALPELRRLGYSGSLSTGALAAGGTLGILIPPSVILIIYSILTEQNIAKLFLAAFIPGILAALGYVIAISIYVRLHPDAAGVKAAVPYAERFKALFNVWPVLLVFALVVGGIYKGWFTPTEGAAVGAAGTGFIAWINGGLTRATFVQSFMFTAKSTAMIFFIILGAGFYNGFLALTQVPQEISNYVVSQGFSPWAVLSMILLFYLVFGCLMDSLSMILLTVPIFFPVVVGLDFGMSQENIAIWFGILVLIVVEVGLITPPVGMNLFVINAMDRKTPLVETYKVVMYFVASDIVRVIILVAFPAITLFWLRF